MIDKRPLGFLDPDLIEWQPEASIDGLYSKTLTRCELTGSYTRMLKLIPGTITASVGALSHEHLEEIWIVEGAIHDLTLEQNFTSGMYANRLAGMKHGPWRARDGAVTVEIRDNDPDGAITKSQLEFFDPSLIAWATAGAGVFVKTLTSCAPTGSYSRLVKYQPEAQAPTESQGEPGRSEVWVVAGNLVERASGRLHPAGTYGSLDLDLLDGSWTSHGGCVVLEVRNRI